MTKENLRTTESPALLKLLESMYEMQAKSKLASQEPNVFYGNKNDMLKFPIWLKDFEDLIEKSTKESSERLRYLNKYTKGNANNCVSGFLGSHTPGAYESAKSNLIEWHGNLSMLTRSYKDKLREWPVIKTSDGGKGLKEHIFCRTVHMLQIIQLF